MRDGRLSGRGAVDTKASVAVHMWRLARLGESADPAVTVVLAGGIDEEQTFKGVREVLSHLGEEGMDVLGVIVGEPTETRMGVAHKGMIRALERVGLTL